VAGKSRKLFSPGEYIRDELEARGWMQDDLAAIMGRPLKTVNQIITGVKAITPQTAKELAAAFGTSAELWVNLESAYRLALEDSEQGDVARRAELFGQAPIREMMRRRWITTSDNIADVEDELRTFLTAPNLAAAARKSTSYDTTTPAQKAWLCRAYNLAAKLPAGKYDQERARKMLPQLHLLTVSEQEIRKIPAVLAEMGIRFLVVEHLQQTKIDGAALWRGDSPVIVVSLRFDRIDGFWHTLCHELSHVLHGDGWTLDDDLIGADRIGAESRSEVECRADDEASNFLVPSAKIDSFIARHRPRFSKVNIIRFANLHQIHPGIVVGQLQHRKAIKYSHSREMLVPVRQLLADVAFTDGWGHFPD
jgi:HTH-type transcriptional regulator / antitoxin HigA